MFIMAQGDESRSHRDHPCDYQGLATRRIGGEDRVVAGGTGYAGEP